MGGTRAQPFCEGKKEPAIYSKIVSSKEFRPAFVKPGCKTGYGRCLCHISMETIPVVCNFTTQNCCRCQEAHLIQINMAIWERYYWSVIFKQIVLECVLKEESTFFGRLFQGLTLQTKIAEALKPVLVEFSKNIQAFTVISCRHWFD